MFEQIEETDHLHDVPDKTWGVTLVKQNFLNVVSSRPTRRTLPLVLFCLMFVIAMFQINFNEEK